MTAPHDDAAWLCWRYLLDDLEEDEVAAFEDRLAADERLATALAETARVHEALLLGRPILASGSPSRPGRPQRAAIAIAATLAAIGCGLVAVPWLGSSPPPATDLVTRWHAADRNESDADDMPDDLDDDAADDVPEWLLAAVSIRPQPAAQEP